MMMASAFISTVRMWSITFKTNCEKRSEKKYFVLKTSEFDASFITKCCSNKSVLLCVWHINV